MDDHRFDHLVRLVGRGASRRTLLKGLLGLGGGALGMTLLNDDAAARTAGSRPRLQPPPPPPPTTTTTLAPTTTAAPCRGYACGRDCCASEPQCCDGACCPEGTACLTRVFAGESFPVEEEVCCDLDRTCDGQCCTGSCFWPLDGTGAVTSADVLQRACCPAEPGFTLCPGTGDSSGLALCCAGASPVCCHHPDGRPICLTPEQCCSSDDCPDAPTTCESGVCQAGFTCSLEPNCPTGADCCAGGDNVCCASPDACCGSDCCDPDQCNEIVDICCPAGTSRCGDGDDACCPAGQTCCQPGKFCFALEDNLNCGACGNECYAHLCQVCLSGACASTCVAGEICCRGSCVAETTGCPDESCRSDTDCSGECSVCSEGACTDSDDRCFGDCSRCFGGTCFADPIQCTGCQVCFFDPGTNTGTCGDWDPLCRSGQRCVDGVCGIPCDDDIPCPGECHTCIEGFCQVDQEKCFGDCGSCANTGVCVANAQSCTGCEVCSFNPETNTGTCIDWNARCPAGQTCRLGVCGIFCDDATPCPGECHSCVEGECVDTQDLCFGDCSQCISGTCFADAPQCSGCQVCFFDPNTNTGTCGDWDPLCDAGEVCREGVCGIPCEQTPCPGECHTCVDGLCQIDQDKCFGECGFCANTGVCVANAGLCPGECHVCQFDPNANRGDCIDWDPLCSAVDACTPALCSNGACNQASNCPGSCDAATGLCNTRCAPDCSGKECGNDGCGGSCGACEDYENSFCNEATGQCGCDPRTCDFVPDGICAFIDDLCGTTIHCQKCCLPAGHCCDGIAQCDVLCCSQAWEVNASCFSQWSCL
jgi:hypothetical protein